MSGLWVDDLALPSWVHSRSTAAALVFLWLSASDHVHTCRLNPRIHPKITCASCSVQRRQPSASSLAGESGRWGFGPSSRRPPSPWWSGGGFPVDSSRGTDTWSTRPARWARSNGTARRDGRRICRGEGAEKHDKVSESTWQGGMWEQW